jgi:hypothetical protein
MLQYKAPVMDMKFLIEDVFNYYSHYENTLSLLKQRLI